MFDVNGNVLEFVYRNKALQYSNPFALCWKVYLLSLTVACYVIYALVIAWLMCGLIQGFKRLKPPIRITIILLEHFQAFFRKKCALWDTR